MPCCGRWPAADRKKRRSPEFFPVSLQRCAVTLSHAGWPILRQPGYCRQSAPRSARSSATSSASSCLRRTRSWPRRPGAPMLRAVGACAADPAAPRPVDRRVGARSVVDGVCRSSRSSGSGAIGNPSTAGSFGSSDAGGMPWRRPWGICWPSSAGSSGGPCPSTPQCRFPCRPFAEPGEASTMRRCWLPGWPRRFGFPSSVPSFIREGGPRSGDREPSDSVGGRPFGSTRSKPGGASGSDASFSSTMCGPPARPCVRPPICSETTCPAWRFASP